MQLERFERIAALGGVYSNHIALETAIADARKRNVDAIFCLGDLGAFGPHPDKTFPLLLEGGVRVMQGNYDNSIGRGLNDCQCGYTDPRDNFFAKISYDYTFNHTSDRWKSWMRSLPESIRIELGDYRVLMSHGSPRKMNEFLWNPRPRRTFWKGWWTPTRQTWCWPRIPVFTGSATFPATGTSSMWVLWAGPPTMGGPTSGTRFSMRATASRRSSSRWTTTTRAWRSR